MVSLEQVRLLESKVSRIIDHVNKVTEENTVLKEKLDSYQKRIDELEVLVHQFKDEQSRIEDGFLSALDLLNKFEDALESALDDTKERTLPEKKKAPKPIIEDEPRQTKEEGPASGELDIF